MSRLALIRLVTAGNRSSRFRLAGIAAGVMIGVALFLLLFSASQAFGERSLRSSWSELTSLNPTYLTSTAIQLAPGEAAAVSALDHYQDHLIRVLKISAPEDSTVHVPGVGRAPRPGEYVASPALAAIIDSAPADELGDRYGAPAGVISTDAVEGPDSLVVVVGATVDEVAATDSTGGARIVTEFTGFDYSSQSYRIVAIIGAIAVLIPVLLLISIVTDLGTAQRAERFATLLLIGATPQQVARIAAIETAATTLAGAILGCGLYLAAIPLAAQLEIGTSRFFPDDLLTAPITMVVVVAVTVLGATAVAWWRTRRAGIGPLGTTRERAERRPRLIKLLPLAAGIAALGTGVWLHNSVGVQLAGLALIAGFVLATVGLLLSGTLLISWASRIGATRARTAAQIIGYNRIIRHPRASFRAVAGLVVAVYTVTVFSVAITAAAGVAKIEDGHNYLPVTTLYTFITDRDSHELDSSTITIGAVDGVTAVAIAHPQDDGRLILASADAAALGVSGMGSGLVSIAPDWLINAPAAPEPATSADAGSATGRSVMLVATDGTPAAVERARTAIIVSGLELAIAPITRSDNAVSGSVAPENQFAALAFTGILIAAALSTISLAVSTLAAFITRQRVFGLLRLTGMSRRTLRAIVFYETVLPVATVFIASIAIGTATAWAIVTGLSHRTITWPEPSYYLILAACLALVAGAITATTSAAERLLTSNTTRFE